MEHVTLTDPHNASFKFSRLDFDLSVQSLAKTALIEASRYALMHSDDILMTGIVQDWELEGLYGQQDAPYDQMSLSEVIHTVVTESHWLIYISGHHGAIVYGNQQFSQYALDIRDHAYCALILSVAERMGSKCFDVANAYLLELLDENKPYK